MKLNEYLEDAVSEWLYQPMAHNYTAGLDLGKALVVIRDPIVTIEGMYLDTLPILGMAYCRPDDRWNPIVGVKKALDSAIARGNYPKEDKMLFWEDFEPHRLRILKYYNRENEWRRINDHLNEERDENGTIPF
jgi:hypothetical protein